MCWKNANCDAAEEVADVVSRLVGVLTNKNLLDMDDIREICFGSKMQYVHHRLEETNENLSPT